MKNELSVLLALQDVIAKKLNDFLPQDFASISDKNVLIDFPNVDQMPMKNMFYIQPDYAEFEALTTSSDVSSFRISVFILSKKDTKANLTILNYGYYNALCELLRSNMTLDGTVDFTDINDVTFYPAVEANPNVRGAELSLEIRYTKDY
jgi:hypothetical protein